MKKRNALFAAMIVAAAVPFAACGDKDKSSSESAPKYDKDVDSSVRDEINSNATSNDLLTGELENKTIKWMATWDINPDATGKTKPTALVVFEERYGGKIEYKPVDFQKRYDALSTAINGDEGIDFFYAGDLDAIPMGAVKSFVPFDDYIDFSSPLWEDVQDFNDDMQWKGKHYLASVQTTGDACVVIYNRKTIQEAGLDDPADLYANGDWNWDTFEELLQKFVDPENNRFGIDGWWFEFGLMNTIGKPPVAIENGQLVSNIGDPAMERVQNWIYELYTTNCIAIGVGDYGWTDKPAYIGEGKTLFYPCGLYQFYTSPDQWKKNFGEDAFFVPMPKDPEADEYYIPVGMDAYTLVKGGHNPEGVAKYLDCKRFVLLDEDTRAIADEQMKVDYGWTDEMVDMKNSIQELADANPTIDVSRGVSVDCGKLLDDSLRLTARGVPWNETFDSINMTVEKYIKDINEDPDK